MTGIFVSYSRKDSIIANKLIEKFKSIDLDVWVDWEDIPPAVGWLNQILQGIEQADAFIFLISPDSIVSEVCNVELEHAHKNAKRIIPVVVRDVNPRETVSIIRDLNWIFIREADDFNAGLEKVKLAINLDIDWLEEHRRLQVRALEWDRLKDPSLLLRGGDLHKAVKAVTDHGTSDPRASDLQRIYISFSQRAERIRMISWVSAVVALLIMAILSYVAFWQRGVAVSNEKDAETARTEAEAAREIAEENRDEADRNASIARAQKLVAEKNATIAQAQRSAARAQIFQSRTGGLYTSTLLAVDSYQRNPSIEAEGIMRKNVSLLPIPVKELKQGSSIMSIEVSPAGGSFVSTSGDGTACLTRFQGGEILYCATSSGSVLDAAFSPNGKVLVTSSSDGEVLIMNAENGAVLQQLKLGVAVRDVNISPDGQLLAMARDDGRITLINLENYEFSGEFSVFGSLRVTSFSPNGKWFAAGSDVGSITFWNLETGGIISGNIHRGEVLDIAFSPDSRNLTSGGSDNYAVTIGTASGRVLLRVLNEDWVGDVEYSPDGAWFVTASNDFRIRVWDSRTGEERLRLLQDSLVSQVRVSPNRMWVASTGSDRTVRVWSAANGAEMFQIPLDEKGNVLEFSGDSSYLVTGDSDGHVAIWDLSTLKANIGYLQFVDFISDLVMSPSGGWLAASAGGKVWMLDPNLYSTQTAFQDAPILDFGDDAILGMAVNPAGTLLAVSSEGGQVALYDVEKKSNKILLTSGPGQVITFSPDGKNLILGGENGLVQFRSADSGTGGVIWQGDGSAIYGLSTSNDDLIAIAMDERIVLLDLATNSVKAEVESPGRNRLVKFSPDGGILSSSNSSGRTMVWRMNAGQPEPLYSIAEDGESAISYSPDGRRLFLGETDQILVIDLLTGSEVNRIRQKGAVAGIAFSPDGDILLAASLRTLQFFDITSMQDIASSEIVASACSRLTRNFNSAEWKSFFEDEEYRVLCESLPGP